MLHLFGIRRLGGTPDVPVYAQLSSALPSWMSLTRGLDVYVRGADVGGEEHWVLAGGADVPRFHHPTGIAALRGLVVEPACTNLFPRFSALGTAPWTADDSPGFAADNVAAPDGNVTADRIDDAQAALMSRYYQIGVAGISDGDVVTMSCFGKLDTSASAKIAVYTGAAWGANAAFLTALWARKAATETIATAAAAQYSLIPAVGTVPTDVASQGRAWFWGAQLEKRAWPHTPVPTVAASVVCPSDKPVITLAAFGDRISAERGSLRMRLRPQCAQTEEAGAVWPLGMNATNGIRFQGSDDHFEVYNGGARVADVACTFSRYTSEIVLGMIWGDGEVTLRVWKNGTFVGEDVGTWTPPTLGASFYLGTDSSGANGFGATYLDFLVG